MTDKRYQRDINSLILGKRRFRVKDALPRAPVLGGTGYAGKSVDERSELDILYFCTSPAVRQIGPPGPLEASTITQSTTLTTIMFTVSGSADNPDVFTVHNSGGLPTLIHKNDTFWKAASNDIIGITANSTEVYVIDGGPSDGDDPTVEVYDIATGTLLRTLASGTEPWQASGNLGSQFAHCSANDTHFVVSVQGAGHIGYWIYESDFTYVAGPIPVTTLYLYGKPVLRPDKLYVYELNGSGNRVLRIFDLDGTETSNEVLPAVHNDMYNFEVTDTTMYLIQVPSDKIIRACPRKSGSDSFDFVNYEEFTDPGGLCLHSDMDTNRNMTELF